MSKPPHKRRVFLLLAALAAALGIVPAQAEDPAVNGVVVLRNGNVLAGAVRRAGGHYFVDQAGASLQVPADQVELACGSLAEAYELRRTDRVGNSADAHLELARWCLRHNLLDQAAREVLDARTRDPGHPSLGSLDMQIRQTLEIEASRRQRAEHADAAGVSAVVTNDETLSPSTPIISPSPEAQAQFVRSIHPMLIHGCATGGCHQPQSPQQLRLDRLALDGNGNPELIRRNLDAILTQINEEDPASSPLMLRARQAHGARKGEISRPLARYQAALLMDWLNAAAGIEPAPPVEAVAPDAAGGIESAPPAGSPEIGPSTSAPAESQAFVPRDAFDPEIFNRQVVALHADREASSEEVRETADESPEPTSDQADATGQSAAE